MPNAASYTVPDNPADPEAAALDLIERLPADILHTGAFTEVLQDYCSVPHADGAFAGLEWADARQIAAAVSWDCVTGELRVETHTARSTLFPAAPQRHCQHPLQTRASPCSEPCNAVVA